jgi:hypothetical protein
MWSLHAWRLEKIIGSSSISPAAEKTARIVKNIVDTPDGFGKTFLEGRFRYNFNQSTNHHGCAEGGWTHAYPEL